MQPKAWYDTFVQSTPRVTHGLKIKAPKKHRPTRKAPHFKKRSKSYRKVKRFRSTEPGTYTVQSGLIVWTLPRKLRSPNQIKSGLARYGDTKGWEREFNDAKLILNDASMGPHMGERLRLEVVRLSPTKRFFLDRTNLAFCVKGLEDALVRLQFLVDDNEEWEDGPYVTQAESPDGKYWTIVRLMKVPVE